MGVVPSQVHGVQGAGLVEADLAKHGNVIPNSALLIKRKDRGTNRMSP